MRLGYSLLILLVPPGLFALAFIVGCFERLNVSMFERSERNERKGYLRDTVITASVEGFVYLCDGRHTKYKAKLPAVLMLSSDRTTLALVSAGTIARLPTQKAILMSRFADARLLFTVDDPGTCEFDPLTTRQILRKADFSSSNASGFSLVREDSCSFVFSLPLAQVPSLPIL